MHAIIGKVNRSIRRKPVPVPLCIPQTPHACPDANPDRRGGKPATNRLNYGTAYRLSLLLNVLHLIIIQVRYALSTLGTSVPINSFIQIVVTVANSFIPL
jgi:hypothetical protein